MLKQNNGMDNYQFKIYVVEKNPSSKDLIKRIKTIFNNALSNNYTLEVVDILKNPEVAVRDNILASPTLIMEHPLPAKRVIGDISDENTLISMLNLSASNE
jgi:circadian clock protein KaiB